MNKCCENFDPNYDGCQECDGEVEITRADGTVDKLCRAGEKKIKATVDNNAPVYPIRFPAPYKDIK